jgi:hypothetical protein
MNLELTISLRELLADSEVLVTARGPLCEFGADHGHWSGEIQQVRSTGEYFVLCRFKDCSYVYLLTNDGGDRYYDLDNTVYENKHFFRRSGELTSFLRNVHKIEGLKEMLRELGRQFE